MQCGRDRVPAIAEPLSFAAWLARPPTAPAAAPVLAADGADGADAAGEVRSGQGTANAAGRASGRPQAPHPSVLRLVLSPRGDGVLHTLTAPLPPLWLLAGPEGGLADDEEALALAAGWLPLRLGPRILRTETAGLAALAALQARLGDF